MLGFNMESHRSHFLSGPSSGHICETHPSMCCPLAFIKPAALSSVTQKQNKHLKVSARLKQADRWTGQLKQTDGQTGGRLAAIQHITKYLRPVIDQELTCLPDSCFWDSHPSLGCSDYPFIEVENKEADFDSKGTWSVTQCNSVTQT